MPLRLVLAVAAALCLLGLAPAAPASSTPLPAQAAGPAVFLPALRLGGAPAEDFPPRALFAPAKILPTQGYQLRGLRAGDAPYSGPLVFEQRRCDLAFAVCAGTAGPTPWTYTDPATGQATSYLAVAGTVSVPAPPPGAPAAPGVYMARFRPAGDPGAAFSNWAVLLVDAYETYYDAPLSPVTVGLPPRGSSSLFVNAANPAAFTRIEIETNECAAAPGVSNTANMRITKNLEQTYWNPGPEKANQYRWCLGEIDVGATSTGASTSVYSHVLVESWASAQESSGGVADMGVIADAQIAVTYDAEGARGPGLLGGLRLNPADAAGNVAAGPQSEMREHYALLPRNRRLPVRVKGGPQAVHELTFSYLTEDAPNGAKDGIINLWHTEMVTPTHPLAAVSMRYIERGVSLRAGSPPVPVVLWSVVEDWEWSADGEVVKITQWLDRRIPGMCWRPAGGYDQQATGSQACVAGRPQLVLDLLEKTPPLTTPLVARLRDVSEPAADFGDQITIAPGGRYQIEVAWADGPGGAAQTPYSGYLEVELGDGARTLWQDTERKPLYVHRGTMILGPEAYGDALRDGAVRFRVRPYLANWSLDSLHPIATAPGQPIPALLANGAGVRPPYNPPFSNQLTLAVGP